MKTRFYIDLYPGIDPSRHYVFATNQPGEKLKGNRRLAFDVTIPDPLIFGHEAVAPEVSPPTVVGEEDEA